MRRNTSRIALCRPNLHHYGHRQIPILFNPLRPGSISSQLGINPFLSLPMERILFKSDFHACQAPIQATGSTCTLRRRLRSALALLLWTRLRRSPSKGSCMNLQRRMGRDKRLDARWCRYNISEDSNLLLADEKYEDCDPFYQWSLRFLGGVSPRQRDCVHPYQLNISAKDSRPGVRQYS